MDFYLIWLSGRTFSVPGGWFPGYHSLFSVHLFGLPPGCLRWIRVGGSKSAEVQRVWEIYDDRLQFMARDDALSLDESLGDEDVSRAWNVWAAAAVLLTRIQLTGGLVPDKGLVLGWDAFWVRAMWVALKFARPVRTSRIHRKGVMC